MRYEKITGIRQRIASEATWNANMKEVLMAKN
jgi:hypothetical protein